MAAELEAKQRRHDEMQAAAAIQNSILPRPPGPARALGAAVDLHAEMHPAREIGGDFYDYLPDRRRPAGDHGRGRFGQGHPGGAVHGGVAHRAARRRERRRHGAAHGARQPAARDGERRGDVRHRVSRRPRSQDRRADLLQRRAQPALSAARRGRARDAEARPVCRSASPRLALPRGRDPAASRATRCFCSATASPRHSTRRARIGAERLEAALEKEGAGSAAAIVGAILVATAEFAAGAEQSDDITALTLVYRP